MEPQREGVEVCRGWMCDQRTACQKAGRCLYVPSAEAARQARAVACCPADKVGMCHSGSCPTRQSHPVDQCGPKCRAGCLGCGVEEAQTIAVTQVVRGESIVETAQKAFKEVREFMDRVSTLPTDSSARKDIPLVRGLLDYFPAALARVAELSRIGNEKHNPGEELHWARGKSSDHADCLVRHLVDRGAPDPGNGNLSHTVAVVWRALALLQEEEEAKGAPKARAAR